MSGIISSATIQSSGDSVIVAGWESAIREYEEAAGIEIDSLKPVKNLDDILTIIHEKEVSWKIWRHDGSNSEKMRSLVKDSLRPIDKITEIVGYAAMNTFSPSVAIFTAVHYMVSTVNDVTTDYDKVSELFEDLNQQLSQFKMIDELLEPIPELRNAFLELLRSVLVLCGIYAKHIKMKRFRKAMKTLTSGEDWQLSKSYKDFHKIVEQVNGIIGKATLAAVARHEKETAKVNEGLVTDLRDVHGLLQGQSISTERNTILDGLSSLKFLTKQKDALANSHDGTGMWLLGNEVFQRWFKGEENSVIWGYGITGAGKTVLTSIAVEYVGKAMNMNNDALAYIYCDYNNPETHSYLELLCNIARQLAEKTWPIAWEVREFRSKNAEKFHSPKPAEWVALIVSLCQYFRRTYVFIDALDNCPSPQRNNLVRYLKDLEPYLRLFFTSRQHVSLPVKFNALSTIEILAAESDLEMFLGSKIDQDEDLSALICKTPQLRSEIIETVKQKANGMFLMAHLQIDQVCQPTTLRAVREALHACPTEIFSTYDQTLERINAQNKTSRDLAKSALNFIFWAKRPLKVEELRHALAICVADIELDQESLPDLNILLKVCMGMIQVDESSQTVNLINHTLHEYFQKSSHVLEPSSKEEVAEKCLAYLSLKNFSLGPCNDANALYQRLHNYPLFEYASRHWGYHVKDTDSSLIMNMTFKYLGEIEKLRSSLQVLYTSQSNIHGWYKRFPTDLGPLHVASYWGLKSVLAHFLANGADVDSRDSEKATPLLLAAKYGHEESAGMLLENEAKFNAQNIFGETALYWASRNGHQKVVEFLLQSQGRAGKITLVPDYNGWTAMDCAIMNGNSNLVERLLKPDVEDNSYSNRSTETLLLAATDGHDEIVKMLLNGGANVNGTDNLGSTALDFAASEGHESTLHMLLAAKAGVDSKDIDGNGPLHWASFHGNIARVLLQNGADARMSNRQGQTPLCWTAHSGSLEVATLLIQSGSNVNSQDIFGITPLHRASLRGFEPMVNLLLERGANPNLKDRDGWTPLHGASIKFHEKIVNILADKTDNTEAILKSISLCKDDLSERAQLERNAEKKGGGSTRITGLRVAAQQCQLGRLQMMLEKGADVNAKEVAGYTALEIGAYKGFKDVVKLLLDHGANVNIRGSEGLPPLHYAIEEQREMTIRLLIDHGADVNTSTFGSYPLLLAASIGNTTIMQVLITAGANIDAQDPTGQTALHVTAKAGMNQATGLLISFSANLNIADSQGNTPLILAVEHGKRATAKRLLIGGAATEKCTSDGSTALHLAILTENHAMAKLLLDNNANIEARTTYGFTALHIAAFLGRYELVDLLLESGADFKATVRWREDAGSPSSLTPEGDLKHFGALGYNQHRLAFEKGINLLTYGSIRDLDPRNLAVFSGYGFIGNIIAKFEHANAN